MVTSPLIAAYVIVDIPFERSTTNPDERKFYIHQRRLDSSLSNWDRWSRDWTWTLDELMGLAADKQKKLASTEEESTGGRAPIAPKLVVQRCWLRECVKAGRVLGHDSGWYVDCIEGWQYPEWDKPPPEVENGNGNGKWTWGVRQDEFGFGFGWRREPTSTLATARVVSEPTRPPWTRPMSPRPTSPRPTMYHHPTPCELREHDELNRRMNESRRFGFDKKGGLV